jgi:hypothetical protein
MEIFDLTDEITRYSVAFEFFSLPNHLLFTVLGIRRWPTHHSCAPLHCVGHIFNPSAAGEQSWHHLAPSHHPHLACLGMSCQGRETHCSVEVGDVLLPYFISCWSKVGVGYGVVPMDHRRLTHCL